MLAILFLFSLVIYRQVFGLTFFQDDFVWLSRAKDIPNNWQLVFSTKISGFYMPVVYLYFTAAYRFFGLRPNLYFLVNIFIHALNGFLLYLIVKKLTGKPGAGYLAALFFISFLLPIETVAWISSAAQLLPALLLLGTGLAWVNYLFSRKKGWYLVSFFLMLAMVFTKELSILAVPFILFLTIWYESRVGGRLFKALKKYLIRLAPFLMVLTGYACFELILQSKKVLVTEGHYAVGWHAGRNVINNFLLTFVGNREWARQYEFWWLAAAVLVLAGLMWLVIHIWKSKRDILPALSLLWILIAFVPTSMFTWDPYVSRYGYLPSIGTAIFLASAVFCFLSKEGLVKKTAMTAAFLYILINSVLIPRTIFFTYLPLHLENMKFEQALAEEGNNIREASQTGIYPNMPHPKLILPEVFHVLLDVRRNKVKVLENTSVDCPDKMTCFRWNSKTREIERQGRSF